MNRETIAELQAGFTTAYINENATSNLAFKPTFISNNPNEGKKVLASIEDELLKCDKFQISVAFITMGGITPLLPALKELEARQIPGQILTTNYLNFSEPRALKKLNDLSNITVKMYDVERAGEGFHTKGYIFKKDEIFRIIIGSSNITSSALTMNKEWNTKIISTENGEVARSIVKEFDEYWNSGYALPFDVFYDQYSERYKIIKKQREIAKQGKIVSLGQYRLEPNSMQVGFIKNLRRILASGEERALLISATGTGKTYAAAFAMRELGFKRVLFLVHRSTLAKQALDSFRNVFDSKKTMGIVGAGRNDYDADYIFAMVETLHKEDNLKRFSPDDFDCIIMDEAHHSPANTYQKVMKYFKPRLFLGMTATPDKRDDSIEGRNVYELFDYQIAYEIRLQQAMEEELLCPFHYFGISDISVLTDDQIKAKTLSEEDFRSLTSDERVRHVLEQAAYYGYSGDRVKGLIFCSRIKECEELSEKFNKLGYRTMALSGSDKDVDREKAFERLAMNEADATEDLQPLDYIFSVDILNEGVDIVEVNQVIMLRPTQSPIVFIQQLGRGLRKAQGKEYVVILDFIGNYTNNFMIPIALSGDRTYNKDNIRRYIMEGGRVIPGASTIHFDEVSRKRIFESVDNANFSDIRLIKENYTTLKNKLGRIPALKDFDDYGEMDVCRIFDNSNLGSYHKFLSKYEPEYTIELDADEEKAIEFVSKKLANGKRVQELLLLRRLLEYKKQLSNPGRGLFAELSDDMKAYGKKLTKKQETNIVNVMTNEFPSGTGKKTYEKCVFIEKDSSDYKPTKSFVRMLQDDNFCMLLEELIEFGISRYNRDYSNSYKDSDLVLYQKYTYDDVCRLLNWEQSEVPLNIGGYKYDKNTKTFPVFINYEKSDDISDTTKYEDHFVAGCRDRLIAISKSGRSLDSDDVQNFLNAKKRGIQVELFIRKNKDDKGSKEFYYLGHMTASGRTKEFQMPNTTKTAVEIEWILDEPVREDIYEYIVNA